MDSYEYAGGKIILELDDTVVAVRYKEPTPRSLRAEAAMRAGFESFGARFELPGEHYTLIPVQRIPASGVAVLHASRAQALSGQVDVARVAPVFRMGSARVLATDRILVGFNSTEGANELLTQVGGFVLEKDEDEREYLVELPESSDPLKVAAELAKSLEVAYAEPDFVTIGRHLVQSAGRVMVTLGDALAGQHDALELMRSSQAWALRHGDPEVWIAILDEGVDTVHDDLRAAVVGTFDACYSDTFQEPNRWDGHGTACAGIAAAVPNNGHRITGVGAGCSILAVRIAQSELSGGPLVTTSATIRRAIDWSWRNGADVLSNSWGGGAPSTAIARAFERARHHGRDGKGCVMVTPIIAGAVGLVLSANNDLTENQVWDIIRPSADKAGPLSYPRGRNDSMGARRLNVWQAAERALEAFQIEAAQIEAAE